MIPPSARALFREICENTTSAVLATHIHPDGDGIGSQFCLAAFLRDAGKQVRIINHDPTPRILHFLKSPVVPIELYDPAVHDAVLVEAELVVLVDNSAPDRLGRMEPVMAQAADRVLCIDHHPTRDAPWKHNIVDVDACATAAMIYELAADCGWKPDLAVAEAVYVGMATDTGFFRFNSTNAQAHRIAAELLGIGVSPAKAYQVFYERNSQAYTRLLGHALADLRVDAGGAVASVKITRRLIDDLDAADVDASEITTALLAMDGVMVALLFRELEDGRVKVSLRSKGELDVHQLATGFGGGGHRNASGIVMPGHLEEVVLNVTERAASLLAAMGSGS